MRTSVIAVAAALALCGCSSGSMNPDGKEFSSFLQAWEEAQEAIINGDSTKWKANASHGADATIFGGFGGFEKGWDEVGSRYDWAASQFQASGATKAVEYLSKGESGDLAFTVSIERSQVKTGAGAEGSELALRVTQIFRRENGSWKLLHRHADPMVEKKPPGA